MRKFLILLIALLISGCGVYNSRNMLRVRGEDMTFSYGLIACEKVNEIIMLRETNAGKGESKYSIPNLDQYDCFPIDKEIAERVEAEIANEENN